MTSLQQSKYSIDLVNTEGLNEEQLLLIKKLNCSLYMGSKEPKDSIMHYEQICEHDDGFLCEHRLQVIIDFLKEANEQLKK